MILFDALGNQVVFLPQQALGGYAEMFSAYERATAAAEEAVKAAEAAARVEEVIGGISRGEEALAAVGEVSRGSEAVRLLEMGIGEAGAEAGIIERLIGVYGRLEEVPEATRLFETFGRFEEAAPTLEKGLLRLEEAAPVLERVSVGEELMSRWAVTEEEAARIAEAAARLETFGRWEEAAPTIEKGLLRLEEVPEATRLLETFGRLEEAPEATRLLESFGRVEEAAPTLEKAASRWAVTEEEAARIAEAARLEEFARFEEVGSRWAVTEEEAARIAAAARLEEGSITGGVKVLEGAASDLVKESSLWGKITGAGEYFLKLQKTPAVIAGELALGLVVGGALVTGALGVFNKDTGTVESGAGAVDICQAAIQAGKLDSSLLVTCQECEEKVGVAGVDYSKVTDVQAAAIGTCLQQQPETKKVTTTSGVVDVCQAAVQAGKLDSSLLVACRACETKVGVAGVDYNKVTDAQGTAIGACLSLQPVTKTTTTSDALTTKERENIDAAAAAAAKQQAKTGGVVDVCQATYDAGQLTSDHLKLCLQCEQTLGLVGKDASSLSTTDLSSITACLKQQGGTEKEASATDAAAAAAVKAKAAAATPTPSAADVCQATYQAGQITSDQLQICLQCEQTLGLSGKDASSLSTTEISSIGTCLKQGGAAKISGAVTTTGGVVETLQQYAVPIAVGAVVIGVLVVGTYGKYWGVPKTSEARKPVPESRKPVLKMTKKQ